MITLTKKDKKVMVDAIIKKFKSMPATAITFSIIKNK